MVVDEPPDRTTARGFIMPVVTMTATSRGFEDAQERDTGTPPYRCVPARTSRARTRTLCLQMNSLDHAEFTASR
jgi:hypothetical protein